jgi:DMSO/TMAO reductase YedYZ molybdopterin-dependent catalytic subunit
MTKARFSFLPLLGLLAALLIACGGSDSTSISPTAAPATRAPGTTVAAATQPTVAATAMAPGAGGPSTTFALAGGVNKTGTYDLAALKALPRALVTTNPLAGGQPAGQHTFAGPLLYDLVSAAGVKTGTSVKNDVLKKAIVVTGSDGYAIAISFGEIDPRVANKKVLVAYEQDDQALPAKDGFARLIVPGDNFAGRYVSNVVKIEVKDMAPTVPAATRSPTTSFQLTGAATTAGPVDKARLASLKQTEVTIDSGGTRDTYGGVLLTDLLDSAALKLDSTKKNDFLDKGVYAIGSDGYETLIVDSEVHPNFGKVQVLVATTKNGQPLTDADGFARLVVPGDGIMGRYVSNLARIEVVGF